MDQQTKVLLYCLKADPNKINPIELKNMSNVDWEAVINASIKHGVAPLLYQRLKAFNSEVEVPGKIIDRLHNIYFNSAALNMRLFNELSKVLRVLQDDGIPVIVLKGAHLAEIVYNNLVLRPMEDVDLMVKKTDLTRVTEKFLQMGYRPVNRMNIKGLSSAVDKPTFVDQHRNYFDIHWTIYIGHFQIDETSLWERARSATIAGVKTLVLSPEDLLLSLSVHASFHHMFYYRLKSLCDISQAISHYRDEIDWEQIFFSAKQWGVDRCLYLMLYLTDELMEMSLPEKVLDGFKPYNFNETVAALAKEHIFDDSENSAHVFFNLMRHKRFSDKAIFIFKRVFPSPAIIASRYPVHPRSFKIILYYLENIKDLFVMNCDNLRRLLFGDKKLVASVSKENTLRDWLTSS